MVFGSVLLIYVLPTHQLCMSVTSQEPEHEVHFWNIFSLWDFLEEMQNTLFIFLSFLQCHILLQEKDFLTQ